MEISGEEIQKLAVVSREAVRRRGNYAGMWNAQARYYNDDEKKNMK